MKIATPTRAVMGDYCVGLEDDQNLSEVVKSNASERVPDEKKSYQVRV